MFKGKKIYGIVKGKCPRCQEGDLFLDKNPYHLRKLMAMHQHCPKCGLKYFPEPGFYFGAAYVAYAICVAISACIVIALFPLWGWTHIFAYLGIVTGVTIIISPVVYRVSRNVWLSFFTKYDPNAIKSKVESR